MNIVGRYLCRMLLGIRVDAGYNGYKRRDYYALQRQFDALDRLEDLLAPGVPGLQATGKISFRSLIPGATRAQVTARLGKPRFVIREKIGQARLTTLFYRESAAVDGFRRLIQLHFLDNALFMISTKLRHASLNEVRDDIIDKYAGGKKPESDDMPPIRDERGNSIVLTPQNGHVYVRYITGNLAVLRKVKELREKIQQKEPAPAGGITAEVRVSC